MSLPEQVPGAKKTTSEPHRIAWPADHSKSNFKRDGRKRRSADPVQDQRTFFLTTSAETGKPSWIVRLSIPPKPKSWQKRIIASHAGCKPGALGRLRVPAFPFWCSFCLIVLPAVSTESDSTTLRRCGPGECFKPFCRTASAFVSQQKNGKARKESQGTQTRDSQDDDPGARTGCASP